MMVSMGTAMLALVGCGDKSMNQSNPNNSASDSQMSTNDTTVNNPAAGTTNAPMMTNGVGTNLPAGTGQ